MGKRLELGDRVYKSSRHSVYANVYTVTRVTPTLALLGHEEFYRVKRDTNYNNSYDAVGKDICFHFFGEEEEKQKNMIDERNTIIHDVRELTSKVADTINNIRYHSSITNDSLTKLKSFLTEFIESTSEK